MTWQGKRTICEVLREIGDECSGLSMSLHENKLNQYIAMESIHNVLFKLHEASVMAKKMSNKLREYKEDYDKNMWKEKVGGQTNG